MLIASTVTSDVGAETIDGLATDSIKDDPSETWAL